MKTNLIKSLLASLLIILIVIGNTLVFNQAYSVSPEHGPIELFLDADYVELQYGPNAESRYLSHQFNLTIDGAQCYPVVWKLSKNKYATVDDSGLVTVNRNIKSTEGVVTLELTCTTAHNCGSASAIIKLIPPPAKGSPSFPDIFIKPYNESLLYMYKSQETNWIVIEEEETPSGTPEFIRPDRSSKLYQY